MSRVEDANMSTTSSGESAVGRTQRVIAIIESQASQSTNTNMVTNSGNPATPSIDIGLSNMNPSREISEDIENLAGTIISGVNHGPETSMDEF